MAKVYLDSGESFTLANSATVYGSTGSEKVTIASGVGGVITDQNVERVIFSGGVADYKYKQEGNTLKVYDSAGTTLLATMPLQGDSDGTAIEMSGSTYNATLVSGVMKLGGSTIGSTIASATGATTGTTTGTGTTAASFSSTNNTYGTLSASADTNVKALDSATHWTSSAITYSFNASIPTEYSGDTARTNGWRTLADWEKTIAREVFTDLGHYVSKTFSETTSGGDIRLNSVTTSGSAGFAYYPGDGYAGDVFLSNVLQDEAQYLTSSGGTYGSYGRSTVYHEIGHAMGLKHTFEEGVTLSSSEENTWYSVMSYTEYGERVPVFTLSTSSINVSKSGDAHTTGYSIYDIDALQAAYGANTTYNTGDNTYTFSGKTPQYLTIWDAGGKDKIDSSGATGDCTINLNSNTLSSVDTTTAAAQATAKIAELSTQANYSSSYATFISDTYTTMDTAKSLYKGENNLGIAKGVIIEDVSTGSGNDKITDNSVNNNISLGSGTNQVYLYNGGYDTVIGGSGMDIVYIKDNASAVTSTTSADGSVTIVGSYFAAVLTGVEKLYYLDGSSATIA
ncbi:MAG TPA: M10 family metallopeptidase C-terminal domain-containing protein [Campylobacterales bacterium]|nr:M10 family metallopeptidase C-terminal domain-containing protein [Campylobacterales bacterium]